MKKTIFFLASVAAMTMTAACLAEETTSEAEMPAAEEVALRESDTNIAVGAWYKLGTGGPRIDFKSGTYYIYPDGMLASEDGSVSFPVSLADDGSFTVDVSSVGELEDFTVTGEVTPISEESMEEYGVTPDAYTAMIDYSGTAGQLVLTVTYPDPSNPLASEPAVSTVYFLRTKGQYGFLKNYMFGKTWKIGEHVLSIDPEGKMDLNNGASTGEVSISSSDDMSLFIRAKVYFDWDNGGTIKYAPVEVTADTIVLENIDKPQEVLTLEYAGDPEAAEETVEPEAVEETVEPEAAEETVEPAAETEAAEEAAENPFAGTWEVAAVTKGGVQVRAEDVLQSNGMTAEIPEEGPVVLKFGTNFTASVEPVYEDGALTARYTEFGNDMTWTAVLNEDGTATATYDDIAMILIRVK